MKVIKMQLEELPTKNKHMPILDYCRLLIKDGTDPDTILEVYRGEIMAIRVHGIGKGAKLRVTTDVTGKPVIWPLGCCQRLTDKL